LPLLGNVFDMARDSATFFVHCYRKYGPVFKVKLFRQKYTVIAGVEAANFMGTREGRDSLRSREFWEGLVNEHSTNTRRNCTMIRRCTSTPRRFSAP
jgi:hypothetical protein